MKVGVVGCGYVGSTAAYAMVMNGVGREIVLVDKNEARASAEADDIFHAVPFSYPLTVCAGTYADLAGAAVVILTAGVNQKPGETRLQLLERNAAIFAEIVPAVVKAAPDAVLVVATNPVDIMTHLTTHFAGQLGVPAHRVLGSGTTLDTARFRTLLGTHLGIDSHHVHAYVIGEHGDSEVLTWSLARVAGLSLEEYCATRSVMLSDDDRTRIDERVRRAAYHIIGGKGATYYGIGSALARIIDVILHNQRAILSVCGRTEDVNGVRDVTLALPRIVGGEGLIASIPLGLDTTESAALTRSATVIREAIDSLKL
ncbi:MAG TPA: L-lactate dehydrogenase [Planctomycetaceae bacterium]|jgi:L-lactate dehydrogenase|nr:L-lactate dehydrogenase [Planctomycetaceae bacterium]